MSKKNEGKEADGRSEEGPGVEENPKCCGCHFPLLVALLQLLLGVAVAVVAFLMAAISPSLLARETPHWAGIILCVVSVLGFLLFSISYLPDERTSMQFLAKVLYFLLCTIGLVLSVLVTAFAGHHYNQASGFTCTKTGEDCRCTLDPEDSIARTFTYANVADCQDVTGTLTVYFLLQIVLNLAQALVCASGAFVMWKHRYQVFFAGLQIGSIPYGQNWQKV